MLSALLSAEIFFNDFLNVCTVRSPDPLLEGWYGALVTYVFIYTFEVCTEPKHCQLHAFEEC